VLLIFVNKISGCVSFFSLTSILFCGGVFLAAAVSSGTVSSLEKIDFKKLQNGRQVYMLMYSTNLLCLRAQWFWMHIF
jgi:hypothetical protein